MALLALTSCSLAFEKTDSQLFTTTQLAVRLRNGAIDLPSGIRHLFVEVGINEFYGHNGTEDDPKEPRDAKAYLVGFDPLPRGRDGLGKRDRHQRSLVLPYALGLKSGLLPLNVSRDPGCTSFSSFNVASERGRYCRDMHTLETKLADTITLEAALELTGGKDGLPIVGLKLDTGGYDFDMIKATPKESLTRVMRLMLSAPPAGCAPLYVGQASCDTVLKYMKGVGFDGSCPEAKPLSCLEPVLFVRSGYSSEHSPLVNTLGTAGRPISHSAPWPPLRPGSLILRRRGPRRFLPPLEWFETLNENGVKSDVRTKANSHTSFWRKKTFYIGVAVGAALALSSVRRANSWLAVKLDRMVMRDGEQARRDYSGQTSYW